MSVFLAEDFRSMVNRLNNYIAIMREGEDAAKDADNIEDTEIVKFNDIKKLFKDIADISPTAKVHVIKLIDCLVDGMKDKDVNGGKSQVVSKIVDILDCAADDAEADAMKEISRLVSMIEGDNTAFDSDSFPKLVVELILLVGEMAQHAK